MHFLTTRIKSLKNYFLTSGVVKTCFDVFPELQNQVLKKLFFSPLEWLKTCFDAFPDHENQVIQKLIFNVGSGKKRVLMHFQATRIKSLKKTFFNIWSGRKRVFMHLCVLPDHQNQVLKKLFFSPREWLKTCFDAFLHTSPPESSP
jgi:hypothetical protein